jgi:NAD(P)-dependent dehydrogenase (short-subunit alcohol dehydrogenase family)
MKPVTVTWPDGSTCGKSIRLTSLTAERPTYMEVDVVPETELRAANERLGNVYGYIHQLAFENGIQSHKADFQTLIEDDWRFDIEVNSSDDYIIGETVLCHDPVIRQAAFGEVVDVVIGYVKVEVNPDTIGDY